MFRFLTTLLACLLGFVMTFHTEAHAEDGYPAVDELPTLEKLPDPFQFFRSHRRVETREAWEERRTELLRMIQHYSSGPPFPQTHNAKVKQVDSREVYDAKATHYSTSLAVGPDHAIRCTFEYVLAAKSASLEKSR